MGISPESLGVPCVSHRLGNLDGGGRQNRGLLSWNLHWLSGHFTLEKP